MIQRRKMLKLMAASPFMGMLPFSIITYSAKGF